MLAASSMLACLFLGAGPAQAQSNLSNGLILHYTFDTDEGTNVTDQAGGTYNGVATGTTWVKDGRFGAAMQINGSGSAIVTPDAGLPTGDAPRSISYWIRLNQNLAGGNGASLIGYGTISYNQLWHVGTDWRGSRQNFSFSQWGGVFLSSAMTVTGVWQHVVYTYGGNGQHSIYVDGVSSPGHNELSGPINTVLSGEFRVGDFTPITGGDEVFAHFDEIRLYDRELSAQDVADLYEPVLPPAPPPPPAPWYVSMPVGFVRTELAPSNFSFVSMPLVPFSQSLDNLFTNQLVAGDQVSGDTVFLWDVLQGYSSAYKSSALGIWTSDGSNSTPLVINRGEALIVDNKQSYPQDVYIMGEVPMDDVLDRWLQARGQSCFAAVSDIDRSQRLELRYRRCRCRNECRGCR